MMGALLFTGGGFVWAQSNAQPSKGDPIQEILRTCFECHGPLGISKIPTHPSIGGQKGNYIAQQLTAFLKSAKAQQANLDQDTDDAKGQGRTDPIMEHVVKGLDASTIVKIAAFVSRLACRADEAKVKSPAPTLPKVAAPCVLCHGADGIGVQNETPNLAGQQRAYLRRELLLIRETAWGASLREGESSRAHPIMESQVARLKITDVDALAKYYSALDCRGQSGS